MARPAWFPRGVPDPDSKSPPSARSASTDEELLALLERVERNVRDRRLDAACVPEVVDIVGDLLAEPSNVDGPSARRTNRA